MKMMIVITRPDWFIKGDLEYSLTVQPVDASVPDGWIPLHTVDVDPSAIDRNFLSEKMIEELDRKAEEERAKFAKVMAEIDAAKANLLALPAGEVA